MRQPTPHRVVIIGGGSGGRAAAKAFRRAPVEVTLIDRQTHHLFQPTDRPLQAGGSGPMEKKW